MGQVEEVPKEDSKLFFEYLKDSVAAHFLTNELLTDIESLTLRSDKFDENEKLSMLRLLGQIAEDYDILNRAIRTTEGLLQEYHKEIDNLKTETIRALIIAHKGAKEGWPHSQVFEILDKLQRELNKSIEGFIIGLGRRIKDQNKGSAAQGSA